MIFRHETFDDEGSFEMWRFNLAWWAKSKWGNQVSYMIDIIQSLEYIEVPRRPKKRKCHWVWAPPTRGQLKINIDGSYLDELDRGYRGCV